MFPIHGGESLPRGMYMVGCNGLKSKCPFRRKKFFRLSLGYASKVGKTVMPLSVC
jgi:hypothetical protein